MEYVKIGEKINVASLFRYVKKSSLKITLNDVIEISEKGYFTEDDLGFSIPITIDGFEFDSFQTEVNIVLIDINHDDLADGSGKAHTTWQIDSYISNSSIEFNSNDKNGWKNSDYRSYLNDTIFNSLPENLKTHIKLVKKVSCSYKAESLETTEDKLFPPSIDELGFTFVPATEKPDFIEGTKYKNIKTNLKTSAYLWTRTPHKTTSNLQYNYGTNSREKVTYAGRSNFLFCL